MGFVRTLFSTSERFPEWDDSSECHFHRVAVDPDKCDGCKLCTLVCPANVLELFGEKGGKKARVKASNRGCISCNNCHAICANGAIEASHYPEFVGFYRQTGRGSFSPPRVF